MDTKTIAALVLVLIVGLAAGYGVGTLSSGAHVVGQHADITIVVEGHAGGSLGPDGKTHDTMMPSNFTVYVGQTVDLTFINYDEGPHSFTSTDLGVNFMIPGRTTAGVPSVSHAQFTPTKAGVFRWWCAVPCDAGQGGWAMTTGADGGIGQLGFMAGYVTVLSG
jgi:plastocyanin